MSDARTGTKRRTAQDDEGSPGGPPSSVAVTTERAAALGDLAAILGSDPASVVDGASHERLEAARWRGEPDLSLAPPANGSPSIPALASALRRAAWPAHVVRTVRRPDGRTQLAVAVAPADAWHVFRVAVASDGDGGATTAGRPWSGALRSGTGAGGASRPPRAGGEGLVLAIYGVDGSGKSTVLQGLERAVGPAFEGVERWHLFAHQAPGHLPVPVTDPHGRTPRSLPASLAKVGLYLAVAWLRRGPRVRAARGAGKLVILDRDVADPWLDPVRYRLGAPRPLVSLIPRLAPRPDLALVLDADASDVEARSDELERATLERLLDRYRRFGRTTPWARPVDARPPAAVMQFEAARSVFQYLESRILAPASRARREAS